MFFFFVPSLMYIQTIRLAPVAISFFLFVFRFIVELFRLYLYWSQSKLSEVIL